LAGSFLRLIRSLSSAKGMAKFVRKAREAGLSLRRALWLYSSVVPILAWKPDIVHIDVSYLALNLVQAFFFAGCPMILSLRGADVDEKPHLYNNWKQWFRESNRFDNLAFHCVSKYVRDQAIFWGINQSRTFVIYQGIDPNDFKKSSASQAKECEDRG